MRLLVLSFLVLLLFFAARAANLALSSDIVNAEASYALVELAKLSDSGVYSTLQLHKVLAASQEDGIFHQNTMLTLELSSPHFNSGSDTETFDVVVMTHKDDGIRSIAISEFPVMTEASIETFWVQKVEDKRLAREAAFRRLEVRALLQAPGSGELIDNSIDTESDNVEHLLGLIDSAELTVARRKASADASKRLVEPFTSQEATLSKMNLAQLYVVSVSPKGSDYSDFQRERAKLLVDTHLRLAGEA